MTKDQVRRWLEKNPNFFVQHPEVLLQGSERGQVIPMDLGELAYLRKERKYLQNQIQAMMDRARHNEEIHRAFHTTMIHMVAANDLDSLLQGIIRDLEVAFQLKRVTVSLVVARIGKRATALNHPSLTLVEEKTFKATFGSKNKPVIRIGQEGFNRQDFFGDHCEQIRSEILLPMGRSGLTGFTQPVGSLNLGAEKPTRFLPSHSTDLLQDLADILALCLQKILHRP
ncbi:MAG: DUF484 family protein [Magnetococcales bacterium]|nr:DUF484 family protein [Magnetococcales bacterium]NGZ28960.1 DUF484 family protein [Magnetococcales bacterium]